ALMCMSDAPRSTAALMICSIDGYWLIPSRFVHDVAQRLALHVSSPVVGKQIELARPETAGRDGRDVRGEQNGSKLPQGAGGRQWLLPNNVDARAAQAAVSHPRRPPV